MIHGSIGTVSHATMRPEDLIPAFAGALEDLVQRNAAEWCSDDGRAHRDFYMRIIGEAREIDCEGDDAGLFLNETLWDALTDFAAPYCYFGAHPGDGSDYGFWPDWDGIEIARQDDELASGDELPCVCCTELTEFLQVNERGNTTLYSRTRYVASVPELKGPDSSQVIHLWRKVWSVV